MGSGEEDQMRPEQSCYAAGLSGLQEGNVEGEGNLTDEAGVGRPAKVVACIC